MAERKSPVVTLTPSPTLDRTYFVKDLVEGGVNRDRFEAFGGDMHHHVLLSRKS